MIAKVTTVVLVLLVLSDALLQISAPRRQLLLQQELVCPAAGPSSQVPVSVHRLRPGDIRVVAAMGDSLTAANGALSTHIADVVTNYRGVSWSAGGSGHYTRVLTLPNVLKQFSPRLVGYSTGSGDQHSVQAGFNVAVAGSVHQNMRAQARALVKKMRQCPSVNVTSDWKVVTVMIGGNNLCHSVCHSNGSNIFDQSPFGHALYIGKALDILHEELPRTFVNLVPVVDITALRDVHHKSLGCKLGEKHLCPCMFGRKRWKIRHMRRWVSHYHEALVRLVRSGRYDQREDFTVVLQPFNMHSRLPLLPDRAPHEADHSFLSPDCVHLSQRGHAVMARALWNNMVQPISHKALSWRSMDTQLLCPSREHPFFTTNRNPTGSVWYSGRYMYPHDARWTNTL